MPTTAFASSGALGVNLAYVWNEGDRTSDFPPLPAGTLVTATDGGEWICLTLGVGGVTGDGYVLTYDEDFLAVMLTTSIDTYGAQVAVPQCGAALVDAVIWAQRSGYCPTIRVAALAAENVALFATATAGVLDDGGTTSPFVSGIVLTTTNGGAEATAPGMLNKPQVSLYATPA